MGLLIVAAAKFEALPLWERLKSAGTECEFVEIGIGAIQAARSFDRLRCIAQDKDVIYVGTAGVFGSFREPYLVRAREVIWMPPCYRASLSWCIEGIDEPFILPQPQTWVKELAPASVICSPTISKSPEILEKSGILPNGNTGRLYVENLELYSCGEAFIGKARSLSVILGVTNAVGREGRRQWKENFKSVALKTAEFIYPRLILENRK